MLIVHFNISSLTHFDIGLLLSIISNIFRSLSNIRPESTRCCNPGKRLLTRNEIRCRVITYESTMYRMIFRRISLPISCCFVPCRRVGGKFKISTFLCLDSEYDDSHVKVTHISRNCCTDE